MPGLQAIRRFQTGGSATAEQIAAFDNAVRAGDYAGAAAMAQNAGYSAGDVAAYLSSAPESFGLQGPVGTDVVQSYYSPATSASQNVNPAENPLTSQQNLDLVYFRALMNAGDFQEAANFAKSRGFNTQQVTDYINTDPKLFGLGAPTTLADVTPFFNAPVVPLKENEVESKTPGLTLRNDPLPTRQDQALPLFPDRPEQGRALRGSMGISELIAQPATRPQLNAGIRSLDLATQQFGDLTRLEQGAPQAAFQIPSTAVAPFGEMEAPRQQISREGLSALVNPQFTRFTPPPLTAAGQEFQKAGVNDQLAAIQRTLSQNPNMTPTQLVNLMSDFGVTPDMIRRSSSPVMPTITPTPVPVPVPVPTVPTTTTKSTGPSQAQINKFNEAISRGDYAAAGALAKGAGVSVKDVTSYLNQVGTSIGLAGPVTESDVSAYMRSGGMVKYQEGGMTKYSPEEVGSRFDVSEYIDPDTGRFYINEFQRDVVFNPELREAERIERLKSQGRGGDTMLVHMSPEEVQGLQALALRNGTTLTINPETGLPEAFKLKKVFKPFKKLGSSIGKGIESGIEKIAKNKILGPIAKIASMMNPVTAFLYAGLAPEGSSFNVKGAAKAAAMQQIGEGIKDYTMGPETPGSNLNPSTGADGAFVDGLPTGAEGAPISVETAQSLGSLSPAPTVSPGYPDVGEIPGVTSFPGSVPTVSGQAPISVASNSFPGAGASLPDRPLSDALPDVATSAIDTAYTLATQNPKTTLAGITAGYSLYQGMKERNALEAAQAARNREDEERRRRYADLFGRTLGTVGAAGGGLVALAKGGVPMMEAGGTTGPTGEPRMVKGTGDGMSDNVPATIEGVQEARLANDEFVVPADVVADIGNGSSSSGAKKLYAMMDRVRKARHGTTKQPPEIDAERLMPA